MRETYLQAKRRDAIMAGRAMVLGCLILFSFWPGKGEALERKPRGSGRYLSIPPLAEGRRLEPVPITGFRKDPPWLANIQVSDDPGTDSQNETSMGIFGENLYLAWNDNRTGVYHVGFSYSTDLGDTWAANQILTEPTFPEQGDPSVAVDDSGYVYVGMLSFDRFSSLSDVYTVRSTDQGQTWGTPVLASSNTPTSFEDKDWITANGESLYVTFASFNSGVDVRFARSTDRGQTFLPHIRVNDDPGGSYRNGSMSEPGPGGEIYVSWGMDDRTSPPGIYVAKSTDGGASFGPNVRAADQYFTWQSSPWRMTGIPVMAVSPTNGDVYIAWNDTIYGSLDVFFSRSTDGGSNFSAPIPVNDNPPGDLSRQFMPWMDVDPLGTIHAVWYDTRNGGWNLDVYYARSTDRGQSFGPNLRVTDQATVGSSFIGDYIAVVADSIGACCAWSDNRNGDQDVYFSRYRAGHDVGITSVDEPPDTVACGDTVPVAATVCNDGDTVETFDVEAIIDSSGVGLYADTQTVVGLAPHSCGGVAFANWVVPPVHGISYTVTVTTLLATDINPTNDTLSKSTIAWCPAHDVCTASVDEPPDTVACDDTVLVAATVCNYGNTVDTFDVEAIIDSSGVGLYADTQTVVGLQPDSCSSVAFVNWVVPPVHGISYTVTVTTLLATDINPTNDTLSKSTIAWCPPGVEEVPGNDQLTMTKFQLLQNYPNPFTSSTTIQFSISNFQFPISLKVYDLSGRLIRTLADEPSDHRTIQPSNYPTIEPSNEVVWDGRDSSGRQVAGGVYLIRLKTGQFASTKAIVLIR